MLKTSKRQPPPFGSHQRDRMYFPDSMTLSVNNDTKEVAKDLSFIAEACSSPIKSKDIRKDNHLRSNFQDFHQKVTVKSVQPIVSRNSTQQKINSSIFRGTLNPKQWRDSYDTKEINGLLQY